MTILSVCPLLHAKKADNGIYLGLHIYYTIIQSHGGRIWAENDEMGVASFLRRIPLSGEIGRSETLSIQEMWSE